MLQCTPTHHNNKGEKEIKSELKMKKKIYYTICQGLLETYMLYCCCNPFSFWSEGHPVLFGLPKILGSHCNAIKENH
jgi:hypothetical protein